MGKAHINGKILDRKGLPKASGTKEPVVGDLFAHVVKPEKSKIQMEKCGEEQWNEFLSRIIDPSQTTLLSRVKFLGMKNQRFCIQASQEDFQLLKTLGVEKIAQEFFNCVGSFAPTFYQG